MFSPEVPIRIDYHGRHVDMQQGPLIGLLVGLTHLTDSQVTLKRIALRSVVGWLVVVCVQGLLLCYVVGRSIVGWL